ncbi:MAG: hypothetical protein K6F57_02275 [Candidatus Saccharibacteria bacterium]|nr:hypothetical protein [Candidatus Saccharibacteria bacterium]
MLVRFQLGLPCGERALFFEEKFLTSKELLLKRNYAHVVISFLICIGSFNADVATSNIA